MFCFTHNWPHRAQHYNFSVSSILFSALVRSAYSNTCELFKLDIFHFHFHKLALFFRSFSLSPFSIEFLFWFFFFSVFSIFITLCCYWFLLHISNSESQWKIFHFQFHFISALYVWPFTKCFHHSTRYHWKQQYQIGYME